MLSVEDLPRSLGFYQLLGAEVTYRFPEAGTPAFVAVRLGESELGLGELGDTPPLHGQALRPASGHRIELCVYVTDLDETVGHLRRNEVRLLLEPAERPWGERVAYAADPDGNLLMLVEEREPA